MREQSGSKTEVCLAMSVRIRAKETAPCSRTQYGTVGTPVYIPCTTLVQLYICDNLSTHYPSCIPTLCPGAGR